MGAGKICGKQYILLLFYVKCKLLFLYMSKPVCYYLLALPAIMRSHPTYLIDQLVVEVRDLQVSQAVLCL